MSSENIALLTERDSTCLRAYKHVAPTEQSTIMLLLRSKSTSNRQCRHSFLSAINGSTFVARRAGT